MKMNIIKRGIFICGAICMMQIFTSSKIMEAAEYSVSDTIYANTIINDTYQIQSIKIQSEQNDLLILVNESYMTKNDKEYRVIAEKRINSSGKITDYIDKSYRSSDNYIFTSKKNVLYVANTAGNRINISSTDKKNHPKRTIINCRKDNAINKKIKQVDICDILEKNKKIYCVIQTFTKDWKYHYYIKTYDVNKKKWINSVKLKGDYIKYESGNLYTNNNKKIFKYSIGGKLKNEYTLPLGDTMIGTKMDSEGKYCSYVQFTGCDIKNGKIYYCNKNGIYQCDTKHDEFNIIYNPENDPVFADDSSKTDSDKYGLYSMKVMNNGKIYMVLYNEEDKECGGIGFSCVKVYAPN